jgi:hypothetical protein
LSSCCFALRSAQAPCLSFLFSAAAKRGRRGSVLGMFNSHEVKVLNQPDGGEGK